MIALRSRDGFVSTTCRLLAASLLLPGLSAKFVTQNITETPNFKLLPGIASVPAPVSVSPDQSWMGIDGSWSTFSLNIGFPGQPVRVLVSTASQQIWAVNSLACMVNATDPITGNITGATVVDSDCRQSRGFVYDTEVSTTWKEKGYYQLWIEKNLGLVGNGLYGFDSVAMGMRGDIGPPVANTTVSTLVTPYFWLGHIGVHAKSTNFSAFEDSVPSYMTVLFDQKSIPSKSFGYTAGAQYRKTGPLSARPLLTCVGDQTILGSLILGGYDASRIIPNDLTFIFAPDNERDLVVGLVGLSGSTDSKKEIDLLNPAQKRDGVPMFIDSTVAELYFPLEICQAFERAFGLQYDQATDLYLVDDALHQSLLAQNPSVTFTLGQKFSSDATVQITLPYAAFIKDALPPYRGLQNKTRFFPIRRGNESSDWVLGRTFLQEAYLTVDWERENFTVSAVDWTFGKAPQILPIVSPQYAVSAPTSQQQKKKSMASAVVIGLAVGGGFFFALVVCAIGWLFWRRRHKRNLEAIKAKHQAEVAAAAAKKAEEPPPTATYSYADERTIYSKAELPGDTVEVGSSKQEKGFMTVNEADGTERQIYEMPGDMPVPQEADGRQLSEKESMVAREKIYNGVDPSGTPQVTPMAQEPRRTLSPCDVSMVSGQLPHDVSPTTPRAPRDGAFLEASDTFFQLPPYRAREARRADTDEAPISPLEESTDASRRRFSYES